MQNMKTKSKPGKILFYTIGSVMIIILAVFILLPDIPDERVISKVAICRTYLKNYAIALKVYTENNNYHMPDAEKWNDLLTPYLANDKYLVCPIEKAKEEKVCTYILNSNIKKLDASQKDIVIAFEGPTGWNQSGGPEMMAFRHQDKCNVALADGTITGVTQTEAKKLKWKL